jgi:hypothetical protein
MSIVVLEGEEGVCGPLSMHGSFSMLADFFLATKARMPLEGRSAISHRLSPTSDTAHGRQLTAHSTRDHHDYSHSRVTRQYYPRRNACVGSAGEIP